MRYDERVWRTVEEPVVAEAVRLALVDFCAQEMRAGVDDERRKRLFALLSASRMRGIMSVIRGRLAHQGAEFDAHPHLLNARNGVVDLRDGSLRPHDCGLMFTKVAMTDYDPEAVHDDWDKALTAVPRRLPTGCSCGWARVSPATRRPTTCWWCCGGRVKRQEHHRGRGARWCGDRLRGGAGRPGAAGPPW